MRELRRRGWPPASARGHDGAAQLDGTAVRFTWTRCGAGWRVWLVCPSCGQRRRALYLEPTPACRVCHRFAYRSQGEDFTMRLIARARAIRRRLGGSERITDRFPAKPPRMRWATYRRLRNQGEAVETLAIARLAHELVTMGRALARKFPEAPGSATLRDS